MLSKRLKILSKIVATYLTIAILSSNIAIIGAGLGEVLALDAQDGQDSKTQSSNIEFDAYFKVNEKNVHEATLNKNEENKVYTRISVQSAGYLKDAKILFRDENAKNSSNFVASEFLQGVDNTESLDKDNNTIILKQINANADFTVESKIELNIDKEFNLSNLSKTNKIILEGTYIDNNGKEVKIEKQINLKLNWNIDANININSQISKYVKYTANGENEKLLQNKVTVSLDKNSIPVAKTKIEIDVPKINNTLPNYVNVVAVETNLTNSKLAENFTNENFTYNKETGKLEINVENKADSNNIINIAMEENSSDIYEITYVYGKESYGQEIDKIDLNAKVSLNIYSNDSTKLIENKVINQVELKENISDILSYDVEVTNNSISKRNMYSNYQIQDEANKRETTYDVNYKLNIGYANVLDSIKVESLEDYFVDENENKNKTIINNQNITYFEKTQINKVDFLNLFGEDGTIKILNTNNELLFTIDKNFEVDKNGNIVINYEGKNISNIIIETSKPQKEGILEINNTKQIRTDVIYSKAEIQKFKILEVGSKASIKLTNVDEYKIAENTAKTKSINLEETKTNATIKLSNTNLSTMVLNQDVELKIEFNNDKSYSDFYINPTFTIELPEAIEDINIKSANILFNEGLKIVGANKYIENGKIYIKLSLEGIQNIFNELKITNGTNIVLVTDIKVKITTPAKQDNINLYYTNENATSYENKMELQNAKARSIEIIGVATQELTYAAPTGFITGVELSNFENTGKTINSLTGDGTGKLEIYTEAKTSKYKVTLMNNETKVANNVVVLGRIGFTNNKDLETGKNLGTTMDTILTGAINVTSTKNYTVYYSENKEATKDIALTSNGWTANPSNYSAIKSYLIIFTEDFAIGDESNFEYNYIIPANLEHEQYLYQTTQTNYVLEAETKTSYPNKLGLTTGAGPILGLELSSSAGNGNTVKENEIIKYTIKVTNSGKDTVENVVVKNTIPTGCTYVYYNENIENGPIGYKTNFSKPNLEWAIGTLKKGETKTVEFEVKVGRYLVKGMFKEGDDYYYYKADGTKTKLTELILSNTATVLAKDLSKEVNSNKVDNIVIPAQIKIDISSWENCKLKVDSEYTYKIYVKNIEGKDLENVVINNIVPEGLIYQSSKISFYPTRENDTTNATYKENEKTLNSLINTLKKDEEIILEVTVKIDKLQNGIYEKIIPITANASVNNNEKVEALSYGIKVGAPHIVASIEANPTTKYVVEGQEIEYKLILKNIGSWMDSNVKIKDILPDGLKTVKVKYGTDENYSESIQSNLSEYNTDLVLNVGETFTLILTAKAQELANDIDELAVTNHMTIYGTDVEFTTDKITHIIQPNPENNGESENNGGQTVKYKIEGTAWLDENKNGIREDTENVLEGITVKLLSTQNNNIIKTTKTENNGTYSFTELEQGSYLVLFDYDANKYNVTKYQSNEATENNNSDAISTTINEDGNLRQAAVTDIIKIVRTSKSNIDIGLYESPKFDLKLDKYVSKITVQNGEGTKVYNYENVKLAKADITGKQVAKSTVIIEYTIVVQNEGQIAGYAKKIVDYMPNDLKFSSELNTNWYQDKSGNLYNTELANDELKPGEGREVKLILTKKMTDENLGITNNIAEIAESYNEQGLKDNDSIAGNKVQGEDDISSADVLISIKTGAIIIYTTIAIVLIIIIGSGIYVIKKKILSKEV